MSHRLKIWESIIDKRFMKWDCCYNKLGWVYTLEVNDRVKVQRKNKKFTHDLEKAYARVTREILKWKLIKNKKIKINENFSIRVGVRQFSVLSLHLFSLMIYEIMKDIQWWGTMV